MLDEHLPLEDGSVDRALAKNVLEYVPDVAATLTELHRVMRTGGRLLAIDSDWGFVIAEPLSADEIREVFTAASHAFREPLIGRKLRGAFLTAGFTDVAVNVFALADVEGMMRGVLDNMFRYGLEGGRLRGSRRRAAAAARRRPGRRLVHGGRAAVHRHWHEGSLTTGEAAQPPPFSRPVRWPRAPFHRPERRFDRHR